MCEQSSVYQDGDIVWVKLSNCWWPGEVHDDARLPADMVSAFKKKRPYAIVKFFQEDSYEYVKNVNNIHDYRSDRRLDFIRKGLDLYQANHKYMEMFPADVATAERRTKGNPDIINDPAVLNPAKQTSSSKRWAEIFNSSPEKKAAIGGKRTATAAAVTSSVTPRGSPSQITSKQLTPLRPTKEHEVRILSSSTTPSPMFGASISASGRGASSQQLQQQQQYKCQLCNFSSGRMNLLILHSKTHTNTNSNSSNSDAMARRLSLSSNKSMLTPPPPPQKRFSTASSCASSSSPALSPVNSPPPAPVTVSEPVSPPPPPVNKSRPPKKRTKRVPEEQPVQSPPPPPSTTLPMKTTTNTSLRRSRNRRRSSTPPPAPPIEEPIKVAATTTTTETEESPARIKDSKSVKVVALEQSLLKDWSDSDEEEDEAKSGDTNKGAATSPSKPAEQTETAGTTEFPQSTLSGRSSPIRCRNIPKKDRREIILEEFEPKISPNRTEESLSAHSSPEKASETVVVVVVQEEQQPMVVSEDVVAVVSEGVQENEQIEAPIVQKKKKAAAIERLSQQSQEEGETIAVNLPAESPVAEEDQDREEEKTKAEESAEINKNQLPSTATSIAVTTNAASCFDFEEDSPPATVLPKSEPPADEDDEAKAQEQEKIKLETEKKDLELLAQIGNILSTTSDLVSGGNLTVDKNSTAADEVSPTKAKLADTSLPPKERGKRIFKSRNTNATSNRPDEPVESIQRAVAEMDQAKAEEKEKEVHTPRKDNNKKDEEDETTVKQEDETLEIVDKKNSPLSRKRKLDKQAKEVEITKSATPEIAVLDEEMVSPEKKIPRIVPSPESEEISTEPEHPVDMEVVEDDTTLKEEEEIEQSLAIATKPKKNKSDVPNNNKNNNGESESSTDSSPVKTSSKNAQKKVQLVQRVKISTAATETPTVVPVTTPVLVVEPEQSAGDLDVATDQVEVNGSGHRTQDSPVPVNVSSPGDASATASGNSNSDPQILAIPAETFGGPANSFYLCTVDDGNFIPIDNQPLYLDASNQLVPTPQTNDLGGEEVIVMGDDEEMEEIETEELVTEDVGVTQILIGPDEQVVDLTDTDQKYILTTGNGQQILLDLQSLLTIASGGEAPRLVLPDGQEMVIEGSPQEILSSITISPTSSSNADLEFVVDEQSSNHDLIGAALDSSMVYPSVSAAYVSETNAVLTRPPIMSTLETPSKADVNVKEIGNTNLEESLAVLGVKKENKSIPSSLELPITITNPKIVAKTTQAAIKTVYMTTTAVCGSKVESEEVATDYWTTTKTEEAEEATNGHDDEDEQQQQEVVMVVEEEEDDNVELVDDETLSQDTAEGEVVEEVDAEVLMMVVGGAETAIIESSE